MKNTLIKTAFDSLKDRAIVDVSHRGGNFVFDSSDVIAVLFADKSDLVRGSLSYYLPSTFGAFCNYLGGGLRGSVAVSNFSSDMPGYAAKRLIKFGALCKATYVAMEDEMGLNDVGTDEDPNWDALGTAMSRRSGTVSAY